MTRIRQEFNKLITDNPIWVVYIKQDKRFICKTCYSEPTKEGEVCDTCLGTGHKISISRIPVRINKGLWNPIDVNVSPGIASKTKPRIYFQAEYLPTVGDLIVEGSWNLPLTNISYAQMTNVLHVYILEEVEPYYETELSFFTCISEQQDLLRPSIEAHLVREGIC